VLSSRVDPGSRFVEFKIEETEQSVPERFEQQVAKHPDHLAVKTRLHQLTYAALNRSANLVARAIRQQSANDGNVALLLEHDAPAIVAIFAALKAGKIFVPLDPSLPHSRTKYILNDSGASLIITNSQILGLAQNLFDGSRSCIDMDHLDTSLAPDNSGIALSPDSISCILYTSGSTGQPKGVLHTHRNELHSIMHHTNNLRLSADDRFSLLAPYGTGQGIQDIFSALLNGGTLYPWNMKSEGLNGLADWLVHEKITVYHSAATIFRHFVRNLSEREEFPDLRVIKLGSEQVSWKDVESYKKHFSRHCILLNAFSSSETKTIRQYLINKETQISGRVHVGYPVEDMEVLILDEAGHELGPNHVGEIAVRSRYLSPGYWQKPDLTAAAYLLDPRCPDNRIFRTGEWGRMSSDGCLEHLGRKDAQVKIQGYRVETNEIELALLQSPAVDEAFVMCRESTRGDKYLAAYLVLNHRPCPTVSELRTFLKERIPDYMVPSAFIFLESLPLTSNGKIDRSALPEPRMARPVLDVPLVAPKGPIEEALANMWAESLGIDELGVHDNLFDLGGNSLLAMQIIARVENSFRVKVPLNRFLESSTIASLSRTISTPLGSIESPKASPMEPAARNATLPLSFSQQRLWFLDQWEPGNAVYNICRAYYLRGHLDMRAMEESLNGVVQRHEVLRTTFAASDGQPAQVIAPVLRLTLGIIDLQKSLEAERDEQRLRLANEEARRPFDLARGPLLRAALVKLAEEEHLFLLTAHQIVCDGWSMQIFLWEFWTLYEAFSGKRLPSLPALAFQYADFAVCQRRWLQGDMLESALSYWKKQLGDSPPVLNLPTDHSRPALQSFCGARQSVVLAEPLTEALKELSRREGVTLFMTLMAAFKNLLYRYTGQEDVTVGFPIANRDWAGTAELIGLFVNTLVLRTDLSGTPTFKEILIRVRDVCLGAYAHQDLPFEKLVEELHSERDLNRNPLFQVMFTFQNRDLPNLKLPDLASEAIELEGSTSKLDLTLSLAEQDGKLIGFFEYSTDLFDRSTVKRMAGHFQTLLQGIVADPDQPISTLPLLTEAERHQLLIEWNDTKADYPKNSCTHELLEAQVERTPEAVAVEFEEKKLSYRELNARANQLAHYFRHLGVGPERLVGICVERSSEMMIGLLGILKAGGAYVPLDPAYPRERLAFMLEDAQVSVLLTQERFIDDGRLKLENSDPRSSILDSQMKVVCLDRDWETICHESAENLVSGVTSDNLAYVIYTSGSTGRPKGVQVLHRSLVNCIHSLRRQLDVTDRETFLALASISYDLAGSELYLPVIAGARVVLASREEVVDGRRLQTRLAACGATAMHGTSSTWRLLLEAGWRAPKEFKILCGGEFLPRELADQLLEDGASLWNLYGPTETTIWSSIAKVGPEKGPVPIGRPIANTQIYILDSHLQPVPLEVHGELYIGGDGLARGYLNRPELTAERFVVIPFSDQAGSRLYRTGDLARYRPDGEMEFIGRVDNQVKIRGYRVELGEIEATLNQHVAVKQCVVVARERESSEEKELVGYIVPNQGSVASVSDLRSLLRQKLPDYMIPSAFVFLNALPLTPNGKVDRSKLPPPGYSRPSLDQGFVEPRSEIEELVAQVWREVLKLDKIGVYDNFFELGGHSLLATRVVARLRTNFDIDLPLRKLFELPTVAALAEHVDFLRRNQSGVSVPPIMPVPRDGPLPLSFSQQRLWFLHKLNPEFTAYNIPAVFDIKGQLNVPALERALNEIIMRHESLRTSIAETDGNPVQQIVPSVTFTLPVVDLSHLPEDQAAAEVQRLSIDDARKPYDIQNAPLMRAKLLRLGEQDHVLILNFHHIVSDGSSLVIFYQEVAGLYKASLEEIDVSLPPLQVQYVDYAVWQHDWFQGEACESQLAYWKGQLSDVSPLNLPTDDERPLTQTFRGARRSKMLSVELAEELKDLSRRAGVTRFMTLLAAFNLLLSRHTGQEDIVVGSTIAGRNRPELDGVIGFFINALALRTDLSGNPSFIDLLKRVREVCLDAYTHQDLPFEKVVEELNPQRDFSRNPLFQVLFNWADVSERVLTLPGCEIVKLSYAAPSAKFDLTVYAPEIDGRVELAIVYNAELFSEARIAGLLEQFSCLLSQIVEKPERSIDQYSLVTPSAQAVLPDPTETLDDTWEGAFHELLSKQAEHAPERLAVVDPNETWTYRELDMRSNQLANYLVASGIQPNDIIAIYAHRTSALVLALLGILRAGAVFVILDPTYPASRLISYLRIARPRGWVHIEGAGELSQELRDYLAGLDLCCRLTLPNGKASSDRSPWQDYSSRDLGVPIQADDPAYVAFTSGSTGEPKGVLCRHGPVTHFLPWHKKTFDVGASDRVGLVSGLSYSLLHRDIFTPLFLGATLYVPGPNDMESPERLSNWLRQTGITVLHLTPALGQLMQTVSERILPSLRCVFFAGDVLTTHDTAMIRKSAPNSKILNFYGATETQRAVGYYAVPEHISTQARGGRQAIPLGRGIKDVQLLLLTAGGQLAGIGELGELYVRSPHLARGYVGDDELTQQKFIVNPFTKKSGDRLFRTGELGRYLPDGNVEWVGRKGRRVNIRGFRVELGEVESVLSQHPAVKDVAVIAKDFLVGGPSPTSSNELRLVAYVVPELDQPLSIDGLRSFLRAILPDYMVPSHFLILGRLPLTPNGKVDHQALLAANQPLSVSEVAFFAPRTDVEQTLSHIVAQVLGREQVGLDENFFRLGGHSLLAAQVAARVREIFGVALELRSFLETPTVANLARQVEVLVKTRKTGQDTQSEGREEIEL